MILIISNAADAHVGLVVRHLKAEHLVLDAGNIIEKEGLTYVIKGGKVHVRYAGRELENVTGVWFRRPRSVGTQLPVPVRAVYQDYCQSALRRHLRQLYALFPDAQWVSDYYAIDRAESKVLQLATAQKLKLHVPDTIFTSSPADAQQFVKDHNTTIVKSQSHSSPMPDDKTFLLMLARKITAQDHPNYDGLYLAPSIFQTAIEAAFDIRATVVGREVFAAKITLKRIPQDGVRDWRSGHYKDGLTIEPYTLPKTLAKKCVTLTKKLGLSYGAIDFVQDASGVPWFLEINPNGQWGFVEEATGQPIGQALARLLEGQAAPM